MGIKAYRHKVRNYSLCFRSTIIPLYLYNNFLNPQNSTAHNNYSKKEKFNLEKNICLYQADTF